MFDIEVKHNYLIQYFYIEPIEIFVGHNPFLIGSDLDKKATWLKCNSISLLGVKNLRFIDIDDIVSDIKEIKLWLNYTK